MTDVDAAVLGWISDVTGSADPKIIGQLPGSTTASLHVVKTSGGSLVLRRYDREHVVEETPDIANREAAGLVAARAVLDELIPELIAVDADGSVTGVPTVLMTFTSGAPTVRGIDIDLLSQPLAKLHRRQAPPELPRRTPSFDPAAATAPEWTTNPDAWSRAFEYLDRDPPEAPNLFLHGDYHPGNVLWHVGQPSSVVDWTHACAGPAATDVAHCRSNLAFLSSVSTAEEFLAAYTARSPGYTHNKWWDLHDLVGLSSNLQGVLALNAFGAGIEEEQAHKRADAWLLHVLD